MKFEPTYHYAKTHEWAKEESEGIRVGISDYAQDSLGDIVYVELPAPGRQVRQGEAVAVIESVKTASDIYAPLSGEITAVNPDLAATPELVNQDPFGAGWLFLIQPQAPQELTQLMSAADYQSQVESH